MDSRHPYLTMNREERSAYLALSNRISAYREMRGLTQREFAQEMGLSWSQLSGCECGARGITLRLALAVADYFGTSVYSMLGLPPYEELLALKSPNVNLPSDLELAVDGHYRELSYPEKATGYSFPCRNNGILRKAANMDMKDISAIFNKSVSMVNGWENGKYPPRLVSAVELSCFFGVTLCQLLGVPETAKPMKSLYLQNWVDALPEEVVRRGMELEQRLAREWKLGTDFILDVPEMFAPFRLTKPRDLKVVLLGGAPWLGPHNQNRFQKILVAGLCDEYGLTESYDQTMTRLGKNGVMYLQFNFERVKDSESGTRDALPPSTRFVKDFVGACSDMPQPIVFVAFGDIVARAMLERVDATRGDKAIVRHDDLWRAPKITDGLFHRINELLIKMGGEPVQWTPD
mgnify:FL=1